MFPGGLREFLAVVREGSIRKAGEALGVASSSVSRKLAVFEHQFGTALFERTVDGLALTPAGMIVADYARSVLADYESLRADLNDLRGTKRRVIRLTVVESVVSGGLVKAATDFRTRFDTVSFRIHVVAATQVSELLRRGDADIGVDFCGQRHSDFTMIAQVSEPIIMATPPAHPHAGRASIAIHELVGLPMAVPDPSFAIRARFDHVWHNSLRGIDPSIALVSNSFESLREFVRCGGGAAILPLRAALGETGRRHSKIVALDHPDCRNSTLDVVVLRKNRLPKIIEQFLGTLVETLEKQSAPEGTLPS